MADDADGQALANMFAAAPVVVGARSEPPPRPPSNDYVAADLACDQRTSTCAVAQVDVAPSILDDLVVHEVPNDAPSEWWFPTQERILGQEPVVPGNWPSE